MQLYDVFEESVAPSFRLSPFVLTLPGRLGKGSFATVKRAMCRQTGEWFAARAFDSPSCAAKMTVVAAMKATPRNVFVPPAGRVDLVPLDRALVGATLHPLVGGDRLRVVADGRPLPWDRALPAGAALQGLLPGMASLVATPATNRTPAREG